jgi:hypothetical protein
MNTHCWNPHWNLFNYPRRRRSSFGELRIDAGAKLQGDAETLHQIDDAFNRAEDAIGKRELDALMTIRISRKRA